MRKWERKKNEKLRKKKEKRNILEEKKCQKEKKWMRRWSDDEQRNWGKKITERNWEKWREDKRNEMMRISRESDKWEKNLRRKKLILFEKNRNFSKKIYTYVTKKKKQLNFLKSFYLSINLFQIRRMVFDNQVIPIIVLWDLGSMIPQLFSMQNIPQWMWNRTSVAMCLIYNNFY